MENNDKNLEEVNIPLILTKEINAQSNTNVEILKIKDLIEKKYLNNTNPLLLKDENLLDKDLNTIKDVAKKIEFDIKEKSSLINESIKIQEIELRKLYNEKDLLNQNKTQSDIINNQQKLIDRYKKNNIDLKSNIEVIEEMMQKKVNSNKKFLTDNEELKTTINRYIIHNKKLQDNIIQIKKDLETSFSKSQMDEMIVKIKFYQEENIRLSSEVSSIKKDYEATKNNFINVENEKNNIYKQIKELSNSLDENKIIPSLFEKKEDSENSKNLKKLADITNIKLEKQKKTSHFEKKLDDEIDNIFN